MKCFEQLALTHLRVSLSPTLSVYVPQKQESVYRAVYSAHSSTPSSPVMANVYMVPTLIFKYLGVYLNKKIRLCGGHIHPVQCGIAERDMKESCFSDRLNIFDISMMQLPLWYSKNAISLQGLRFPSSYHYY